MKIIASVTPNTTKFGPLLFPGEIEHALDELSALGYDGIELSLRTPEDINRVQLDKKLEQTNMELISIATGQSYLEDGYTLFHLDEDIRKKTINRIKGFIDLISSMGGGSVILGGIKGRLEKSGFEGQFEIGCEAMESCLVYARKNRVTLLLEAINRYETNLFNTVSDCLEFVTLQNNEFLKILPDTFHMNIEEVNIKDSLDMACEHIGAIHCADSNRLAPGMGHLDFSEILSNIKNYKHLSYLGVEVLPKPNSVKSAKFAIDILQKAINHSSNISTG